MTFVKGTSGNPNGRPKGVSNKAHIFLNHLIPHAPRLMEKALSMAERAEEGNSEGTAILKLLVDRILPKSNDNLLAVGLLAGTLNQKSNKVFDLMSNGEIAVSDGSELMKALSMMQGIDMSQILARLDKLDKAQENIASIIQENNKLKARLNELEKEK